MTVGKDRTPDIPIPSTEFIGTAGAHLFAVAKPTVKTRKQLTAEHRERLRRENEGLRKRLKDLGLEPDIPNDDVHAPETKNARRLVWENQRLRRQLATGQPTKAPASDTDNDGIPDKQDPNPVQDGNMDTDGDGIPDKRDPNPSYDENTELDVVESLADPSMDFMRFTAPDVENRGGGAEHPIPVYPSTRVELAEYTGKWDMEQAGVPAAFDPAPGEGTWNQSAGDVWDRQVGKLGDKRYDFTDGDAHDSGLDLSGSPPPRSARETSARLDYADILKDQPGDPSPLDREGAFSQAPPVDLFDAPLPATPKLNIPAGGGRKAPPMPVCHSPAETCPS